MAARIQSDSSVKAAISVAEMAKILGFSRNHFWSLCKRGIFPMPLYTTGPGRSRPYFTIELQDTCRQIRATNISQTGQFVLFYEPRKPGTAQRRSKPQPDERIAGLVASMSQLGLSVTEEQVAAAIATVYPNGLPGVDGQVIRTLFQHLKRTGSG